MGKNRSRAGSFLNPNQSLGAMVRETYLLIKRAFHDRLHAHKITTAQWVLLRVLWQFEGINQKELAQKVGAHPSTLVSALSVLERNGYVRRERSEDDRRNAHVYLTAKGRALEAQLIPFAREINATALEGFSDREFQTLRDLLARIRVNLQRKY